MTRAAVKSACFFAAIASHPISKDRPMNESPFATHRAILVDGDYSAAGFLQSFALAMTGHYI
jgi:hypothetical protein